MQSLSRHAGCGERGRRLLMWPQRHAVEGVGQGPRGYSKSQGKVPLNGMAWELAPDIGCS